MLNKMRGHADGAKRVNMMLRAMRDANLSAGIGSSQNRIIDRLLHDSLNVMGAWSAIARQLPADRHLARVLEILTQAAAGWEPAKTREIREGLRSATERTAQISAKASELADLLESLDNQCEKLNLTGRPSTHPVDLMERWQSMAETSGPDDDQRRAHLFQCELAPHMEYLAGRYDAKYWPDLTELLRALADGAQAAKLEPADAITAAALASGQGAWLNFARAAWQMIEFAHRYEGLPRITIGDAGFADIVNCALGLGEDDEVNAGTVKTARRRKWGTTQA
ncbi:MAG: hypothetical protein HZT41_10525 [Dechloromonas sp.]|nr:MAG: hypothetical protein HZT41_10525 [Dechloromonas sp.]